MDQCLLISYQLTLDPFSHRVHDLVYEAHAGRASVSSWLPHCHDRYAPAPSCIAQTADTLG